MLLAAVLAGAAVPAAGATCRQAESRSGIRPADRRAIERAVVVLPAVGSKLFAMNLGAVVPPGVPTKAVPKAVAKLWPKSTADRAFRSGYDLVIVDARSGRIVHKLRTGRIVDASCP